MKNRLAFFLPYLCALLVLGTLVWANKNTSFVAHKDLVCNMDVGEDIALRFEGKTYFFCTEHCREQFLKTPETYLASASLAPDMHVMLGLPNWMYYGSVGLILVLSFGFFERKRYSTK